MQFSNYLGEFLALATIHFLAVVAPGPVSYTHLTLPTIYSV